MTTILVERDPDSWLGGSLEINEITGKMGLRMTSSSEMVFHNLKIPKENVLGERGRGLMNVLDFLDESRIEIGAQALGNCEGAFLKALAHMPGNESSSTGPLSSFRGLGTNWPECGAGFSPSNGSTIMGPGSVTRDPRGCPNPFP